MPFRILILCAPGKKTRLDAAAEGLRAQGAEVVFVREGGLKFLLAEIERGRPDAVLVSGMHVRHANCRGYLRGLGVPFMVLDCGYFQRAAGPQDSRGYNQLGLGQLNWVPPGKCDATRWEAHGITVAAPAEGREKVALVLGQVPDDSQHHLTEAQLECFLSEEAACWTARGYRILFRPHPAAPHTSISMVHERSQGRTLQEDLARAAVAICYNSTAGLEALIAGLPVACHPSAHYAGIRPGTPALLKHCHKLAWTQWTCAELRTPAPWQWMDRQVKFLPKAVA
jgi:hypothetical protein